MSLKRELIYIDGKDQTDRIEKYSNQGNKCVIVFKNSDREFHYGKNRAKIVRTSVSEEKAFNVFNYLHEIADTVGLKTDEGSNILSRSYKSISVIPEYCILSSLLNGSLPYSLSKNKNPILFPFGFNISQQKAVNTAFSNNLSIIEGPPGTGKTQTILNIIANAVLNGQSVAVVSSNNSATKNVYEKLEKNGVEFIAALLGNSQNKKEFIASQKEINELSQFNLTDVQKAEIKEKCITLADQLTENLSKKNELATLKLELENTRLEYEHFKEAYEENTEKNVGFKKNITANKILEFWITLKSLSEKRRKINFFRRIMYWFKYGIKDKAFYMNSFDEMILSCQSMFYPLRIHEISVRISSLEQSLKDFAFDHKMKEYTDMSMQLFKAELCKRYNHQKRVPYTISELRQKSGEFIKDYPVIMSTTYSLRQSLSDNLYYDYVIIDEASQVDLATGALALSCAKRAVIVGDVNQLPNVVNSGTQIKTDRIFDAYKLKEPYRYSNHSLLSSILELLPTAPKTLLKEHYRCNPKIIEFCNKKFYDDQLIVHTEHTTNRQPLIVYKTTQGNHARERMNQRQIDIIKHEIIPSQNLENVDLGIVTPYRNQTYALQKTFKETSIKADTVDKFQGRENEVIILSTVDNEISDFTDNPNRLNVAVSRAIDQLIVVVSGNEMEKENNISDLIKYIEYNNFSIIQSELNSIFDLLYQGYEDKRSKIIEKSGKVSEFDSENLMYGLIKQVLAEEKFLKYNVLLHYPIRQLIRDYSKLDDQEIKYVSNSMTHLDFLIYNKLGKTPVLGIEVDGFEFHKQGTRQEERDRMKDRILEKYNFPILRFGTNESKEKEKLINKLNEL
ncbi:AAA family ATPase [Flammeovirga yaeyamensis]|uniref:AAA family ATPase n=1 Tax=Flammeovirga yaeyamensis TaxID=367791 RepID=A0AAX1NF85_9BACT|nr:AAA domain-containing protein [Flammeovirga yaeyamensis]MBB3696563.1 superfamily I DNA and/or RNA helicase [Flammeovirga yaeyamensis]NMF33241.1 AAA family ATPase [Flammeovirga yaeyamensis]QWG05480.1 AAA family ATPase [Flammeovirga yaeyamensis]